MLNRVSFMEKRGTTRLGMTVRETGKQGLIMTIFVNSC